MNTLPTINTLLEQLSNAQSNSVTYSFGSIVLTDTDILQDVTESPRLHVLRTIGDTIVCMYLDLVVSLTVCKKILLVSLERVV